MSKLFVAVLLLAVASVMAEQTTFQQFQGWMVKHNKAYDTSAAWEHAFNNFKSSIERVARLNARNSSATFALNKFSDLSPEEFRARYLTLKPELVRADLGKLPVAPPKAMSANLQIPSEFDWRDKNAVTYVKDQGQCGSCWAFSVVENIESQLFLANKGQLNDLSEQQILDCDVNGQDEGCNGGYTTGAFDYVIKAGGLESEDDYSYYSGESGDTGPCDFDSSKIAGSITGWSWAVPTCNDTCDNQNATLLAQQLYTQGPLSICVVADDQWQDYSFGVIDGCSHDANDINHGVQLTGFDMDDGFWIIRNSWGEDWGNMGYVYVGTPNECGVADIATYALV